MNGYSTYDAVGGHHNTGWPSRLLRKRECCGCNCGGETPQVGTRGNLVEAWCMVVEVCDSACAFRMGVFNPECLG